MKIDLSWWETIIHNIEQILTEGLAFKVFGNRAELPLWQLGVLLGIISLTTVFVLNYKPRPHMLSMNGGVLGFFSVVLIGPVVEEIIFRLVLISVFTVMFESIVIGVAVSAFLFGIGHALYGGMRFVDSFITGLMWGWAFTSIGLAVTIVAHVTHNFFAFFLSQ